MCTVSWAYGRDGYDLLCNRDERCSRSRALFPRSRSMYGVRYMAPADPDGGGTWIGVNEYGVAVCLLNAYPAASSAALVSRGRLVSSLLASRSTLEAMTQISRRDLSRFAAFTIVALDAGTGSRVATWNGQNVLVLPDADELCPLTSSSLDQKIANAIRREEWKKHLRRSGQPNVRMLQAFHRSHGPYPGAWSVCMHREDARTVSFTHVSVSAGRVQMHYSPDAPCRADLLVTTTLKRRCFHDVATYPAGALDLAG